MSTNKLAIIIGTGAAALAIGVLGAPKSANAASFNPQTHAQINSFLGIDWGGHHDGDRNRDWRRHDRDDYRGWDRDNRWRNRDDHRNWDRDNRWRDRDDHRDWDRHGDRNDHRNWDRHGDRD